MPNDTSVIGISHSFKFIYYISFCYIIASYGILSVLLQAYFDVEYLFTLGPEVFTPPPKVNSGVIRVVRNWDKKLDCDPQKFKQVVKMAFNQRRKTLRNALRAMQLPDHPLLTKRAEQLGVAEFTELTELWKANGYVGA